MSEEESNNKPKTLLELVDIWNIEIVNEELSDYRNDLKSLLLDKKKELIPLRDEANKNRLKLQKKGRMQDSMPNEIMYLVYHNQIKLLDEIYGEELKEDE